MGNLYDRGEGVGHDAWTEHPYTCKKFSSSRCERCTAKKTLPACVDEDSAFQQGLKCKI